MDTPMNSNATPTEERLRAALAARAALVTQDDLRPAAAPVARRPPPGRWFMTGVTVLAAAAATTAIMVVASHAGNGRSAVAPAAGISTSVAPAAPLHVAFTTQTSRMTTPTAELTYPKAVVTGGTAQARETLTTALDGAVTSLLDEYGAAVRSLATGKDLAPASVVPLEEQISAADTQTWDRFLSVRFDEIADFGGVHPTNRSRAVVFDTVTNRVATAGDLFTEVRTADSIVHRHLIATGHPGQDTEAVSALTMAPGAGGWTTGFTWYPAPDGLHWVVDRCLIEACAAGPIEITAPWSSLKALRARPVASSSTPAG